jgi:hypothetical protein
MNDVIFVLLPYLSSTVYVEGDIETRVYNDSINDQVRNIPEICVRRDGTLIQTIRLFLVMFLS